MANPLCEVLLTAARLEAPKRYSDPEAGATVAFWGVVRASEGGRQIEGIDYEAHPKMAEHQLRLVAEEAAENFQLEKVILHHRTGFVPAGEASLFLQVSAGHRAEAFQASQWIVDELKRRVPIWKHPRFQVDLFIAKDADRGRGPASPAPATTK
jgi:molybdopterin synthase catalytic subunit